MARKSKGLAEVVPLKVRKCPICGKPAKRACQPFCSGRCADVDLGRWLNEDYRIPTNEAPGDLADDAAGDEDGVLGKS
jgi:uncharacterized protein